MGSMTKKLDRDSQRGRVKALERELGVLQALLKHVLRRQGRSLVLTELDFEAACEEPRLELVEDEMKDLLILRFEGEHDTVGLT